MCVLDPRPSQHRSLGSMASRCPLPEGVVLRQSGQQQQQKQDQQSSVKVLHPAMHLSTHHSAKGKKTVQYHLNCQSFRPAAARDGVQRRAAGAGYMCWWHAVAIAAAVHSHHFICLTRRYKEIITACECDFVYQYTQARHISYGGNRRLVGVTHAAAQSPVQVSKSCKKYYSVH